MSSSLTSLGGPPLPANGAVCDRARVGRTRWATFAVWASVLAWALAPCAACDAGPPITYLLDLCEPASHLVRVTMNVPGAPAGIELQFPAWNGLYQVRDFVGNVQELEARCDGKPQELLRVDLNTWRSGPEACARLELRYAVYANEESVFSSVLNEQHGFLNFAPLLFYLPRERGRGARVKFLLPKNWELATLLEETETPGEFMARNYDDLVDSPAEAGNFQEYQYAQGGAMYRVVVHADPGDYSPERLLASLARITAVATALMRDVPFTQYTFILHFPREGGGGGMEHRDGTAISFPAAELRTNWEGLESTLAHEFFHAWNVKRIRPQSLEPVDYVHGNGTQDLWFCEGLSTTYQQLVLLRAGLLTRQAFYQGLAQEIRRLQERPARRFQSVEQAGLESWLEKYPDYLRPERSISYYNKGALVGFLLDLAIRHATGNQRSLDDLLRRLNEDFARQGRFFTPADLRAIVADLAPAFIGRDDFFNDYVSGTRELDYDTYLGFAGLRLAVETVELPAAGFTAGQPFDGPVVVESVEPGSYAAKAGLEPADILLDMDGRAVRRLSESSLSDLRPGRNVQLRVRRKDRELQLEFPVGTRRETAYRVEEIENPSAAQQRVRHGWLEGTTADASRAGKQ